MKEREAGKAGIQNQAKYSFSAKRQSIYLSQDFILPGVAVLVIMLCWYLIWSPSQILPEIYISMGLATLVVLALLLGWNKHRRQRVKAEAECEQLLVVEQEQRLLAKTLTQAFLALTSQTDQARVLDEILKQVQYLVPCDSANIVLIEDKVMRLVRWQGYEPVDNTNLLSDSEQPLTGFPLDAEAVQTQHPVVVAEVQRDPRWVTTASSAWIHSFMAVPISLHSRLVVRARGLD